MLVLLVELALVSCTPRLESVAEIAAPPVAAIVPPAVVTRPVLLVNRPVPLAVVTATVPKLMTSADAVLVLVTSMPLAPAALPVETVVDTGTSTVRPSLLRMTTPLAAELVTVTVLELKMPATLSSRRPFVGLLVLVTLVKVASRAATLVRLTAGALVLAIELLPVMLMMLSLLPSRPVAPLVVIVMSLKVLMPPEFGTRMPSCWLAILAPRTVTSPAEFSTRMPSPFSMNGLPVGDVSTTEPPVVPSTCRMLPCWLVILPL